jgi:hypothetical protein
VCSDVEKINNGYTSALEKLVALSEKEYYTHLVDINRHQVVVARTLLWLIVVILGAEIAFIDWVYDKIGNQNDHFSLLISTYVIAAISILLGVLSFVFSSLSIPAFGGYKSLYKNSWADYSNSAHDLWSQDDTLVYAKTLNEILTTIDLACDTGNQTNFKRGVKLRIASWLSIWSAGIAILSFLIFSSIYYL